MALRGSSNWWIDHYGKPCLPTKWVDLEWYPGVVTRVTRGTEPIWRAMGAVFLAYNYLIPTSYTGSYSCRAITGFLRRWSGHAWPVAHDINAATNPYIRTPSLRRIRWGIDTDMPAAMIREIEAITANGIQAITWGGRWRTIKDAMHFQLRVTLGEIAAKVYAPRGFYEGNGAIELSLKNGDKGNAVGKHQEGLIAWNPDALPVWKADKDFGDETEEWVKNYQRAADLPQTGIIDGVTSALIISYTIDVGDHEDDGLEDHGHRVTATVEVKIGDPV